MIMIKKRLCISNWHFSSRMINTPPKPSAVALIKEVTAQ
jgi:hypothetical protein